MLEGSSGCTKYVERPEEPWPGTGREPSRGASRQKIPQDSIQAVRGAGAGALIDQVVVSLGQQTKDRRLVLRANLAQAGEGAAVDSEKPGKQVSGAEFTQVEHGGQDPVGGGQLVLCPCAASTDALTSSLLEPPLLT